MRIIDKNVDFYDYMQNVYRDASLTFDRTDSFVVTKDLICGAISRHDRALRNYEFILLQVCNTFWLFVIKIIRTDGNVPYPDPIDYKVSFAHRWQCYDAPSALLKLSVVSFDYKIYNRIGKYVYRPYHHYDLDESKIIKYMDTLVAMINAKDYNEDYVINRYVFYRGGKFDAKIEKHIPILKASGLCEFIEPRDIYFAIEEYFSRKMQASERTESDGITDKEKIANHGFSTVTSFRGKR